MSETSGGIVFSTPKNVDYTKLGTIMDGLELKILNPDPKTGEGEIIFRGRSMFMGYYKNEQATRDTIDNQGFVHSGDVGVLDSNNILNITGRIKELIITGGGENVAPVLIEDIFKKHCKIISNIMVVGDQKPYLSAIITLKATSEPVGPPTDDLTPDVISFLKELGVTGTKISEVLDKDEVKKYINSCLELTNKEVISRAQYVRKFIIVKDDFTNAGGELTPTLKLKRNVVQKKYNDLIEALYQEPKL